MRTNLGYGETLDIYLVGERGPGRWRILCTFGPLLHQIVVLIEVSHVQNQAKLDRSEAQK